MKSEVKNKTTKNPKGKFSREQLKELKQGFENGSRASKFADIEAATAASTNTTNAKEGTTDSSSVKTMNAFAKHYELK